VGKHTAGVSGEVKQERILRGRETDELSADRNLAAGVIHAQVAGLKEFRRRQGVGSGSGATRRGRGRGAPGG
jgi:hypothetical protein